jgi:hypothetical protein
MYYGFDGHGRVHDGRGRGHGRGGVMTRRKQVQGDAARHDDRSNRRGNLGTLGHQFIAYQTRRSASPR